MRDYNAEEELNNGGNGENINNDNNIINDENLSPVSEPEFFETEYEYDGNDDMFNEHINDADKEKERIKREAQEQRERERQAKFAPKPMPEAERPEEVHVEMPAEDTPELIEMINNAKQSARNNLMAPHQAKKAKYDEAVKLRERVVALSEQVATFQERVNKYEDMEEEVGKDAVDSFRKALKDATELRMKISPEEEAAALVTIDEYEKEERELPAQIQTAEEQAEADTRTQYLQILNQRAVQAAQDAFDADQLKKYRDDEIAKDQARSNRPNINTYQSVAKADFNKDFKDGVDAIKNSSKEDIYKTGVFKNLTPDEFDVTKLSQKDLDEAGQIYDRLFMKLHTAYDKHHISTIDDISEISRMTVDGGKVGEDIYNDISLQEFMFEKLKQYGIDGEHIDVKQLHKYEKAFVLYCMVHKSANVVYRPRVFDKDGDFSLAKVNDPNYTFNTNNVQGLVEDPTELSKQQYTFLTFNQMKSLEPYYEEPVAEDPEPEVEEPDPEYMEKKIEIDALARDFKYERSVEFDPSKDDDWTPIDERRAKERVEFEANKKQGEQYTVLSFEERDREEFEFNEEQKELNDEDFSTAPRQDDTRAENGNIEGKYSGKVEENKKKIIEEYNRMAAANLNGNNDAANKKAVFVAHAKLDDNSITPRARIILSSRENRPITKKETTGLVNFLSSLDDYFSEYKNEINALQEELSIFESNNAKENRQEIRLPGGYIDVSMGIPEKELEKAKHIAKYNEIVSCIETTERKKAENYLEEKYFKPFRDAHQDDSENNPAKYNSEYNYLKAQHNVDDQLNVRLVNILKRNRDILVGGELEKICQIDPEFLNAFEATGATFPYNMFIQKDGSYAPDDAKYEALMRKLPMLDMLEERQKFLLEVYLPYIENRDSRELSDEDVAVFNRKFAEFQENQIKYVNRLKNASQDELNTLNELKAFHGSMKQNFHENWCGGRYGNRVISYANKSLSLVERGWPAEDLVFYDYLRDMAGKLKEIKDAENSTEADKRHAQNILKDMQDSFNRMSKGYLTSDTMRDSILDKLAAPIQDFMSWKGANHLVGKYYQAAANRKTTAANLGRYTRTTTSEIEVNGVGHKVHSPAGMNLKQLADNIDIMVKDLNAVEISITGSRRFKDMKNALLDLQRFVRRDMNNIVPREGETVEQAYARKLHELKTKITATKTATTRYFERKAGQFRDSATRRDSAGKQGVEQSRIKMSLDLYDKLNYMENKLNDYELDMKFIHFASGPVTINENETEEVKNFQRDELPELKEKAKARLLERAYEAQKKALETENATMYGNEVAKMLIYNLQRKDGYFNKSNNETFEEYKRRIETLGTRELTKEEIETAIQSDQKISAIVDKEKQNFMPEEYKKLDFLKAVGKYAAEGAPENYVDPIKAQKEARRQNALDSKNYKETLLSTNNQNQAKQRAQSKGKF